MAEHADPHTLLYVHTLPLALAPLPSFASSSSRTLFSHQPPPQPAALWTKCAACRVELVGGINASYWSDRGALWATCGACGCSTRREGGAVGDADGGAKGAETGKGQFERVKKRRRVEEKRKRASVHPTAMKSAASRAAQGLPGALATPATRKGVTGSRPSAALSSISSPKPSLPPSAVPSRPSSAASSRPSPLPASSSASPAPSRPLPSTSRCSTPSASASASPAPSSAPSSSRPSPAPPSSASTSTPTSLRDKEKDKDKKRKRQKPSGLAEMLEAKKKREKEAAGGGAGLMDFLQGL